MLDKVDGFLFEPGSVESCVHYLGLLMDPSTGAGLRRDMGIKGRAHMASKTIQFVVSDLAEWYVAGSVVHRRRSIVYLAALVALAMLTIPLTMTVLGVYDACMGVLMLTGYRPSDGSTKQKMVLEGEAEGVAGEKGGVREGRGAARGGARGGVGAASGDQAMVLGSGIDSGSARDRGRSRSRSRGDRASLKPREARDKSK